jgi:choline dehydrogenase-like flavoprotein
MEHRLKGEIPVQIAHRKFLAGIGAEAAATAAAPLPGRALMTTAPPRVPMDSFTSSQKTGQPHIMNWVAVINDEISQDFGRACEVASREFGMQCRMGNHAKRFVTDRLGQTHDVDNLYVCDASVFLNCTDKTTTLSIFAFTLRTSEYLVEQFRRGDH